MSKSPPGTNKNQPEPDEIEVSVFGPGFGECVVAHVGGGKWLIVDSCLNRKTGTPAALTYLEEIGITPASAVELIVATHWHDDHVAGIDALAEACSQAELWCSDALRCEEFLELLEFKPTRQDLRFTRGVSHIGRIIDLKGPALKFALADMRLAKRQLALGDRQIPVEVWALSPSQYENFLAKKRIGELIPTGAEPQGRIHSREPNHTAVAIALLIGDDHILLGSDLEEPGDKRLGWSAVIDSKGRPDIRAAVFKVPHHGSETAHHDATWQQLVGSEPIALLTPFNRGHVLPKASDVTRLTKLAKASFISMRRPTQAPKRRDNVVQKLVAQTVLSIRRLPPVPGHIRARKKIGAANGEWVMTLFDGADLLESFQVA